MKAREEILEVLRRLKPYLAQKYHLSYLAVFGSVARGEATPSSDVDLLVEFAEPIGLEISDLGDELEAALGGSVDLVSRKFLRPRFLQAIAGEIIDV